MFSPIISIQKTKKTVLDPDICIYTCAAITGATKL